MVRTNACLTICLPVLRLRNLLLGVCLSCTLYSNSLLLHVGSTACLQSTMLTHSSIQLSSNCFSSNCAQPASIACRSFNTPIRAFKARSKQSKSSSRCKAVVPASAAVQDSKPGHTLGSHPTGSWQLYTCRMPLIGLEAVASALEGTPLAKLLQLHMYLLLEGPDQVRGFGPQLLWSGSSTGSGCRAQGTRRCQPMDSTVQWHIVASIHSSSSSSYASSMVADLQNCGTSKVYVVLALSHPLQPQEANLLC